MIRLIALITAALALSACMATAPKQSAKKRTVTPGPAPFEVGPASALAPATAPSQADWATFQIRPVDGGAEERIAIEAFGASGVRGKFADGCTWTRQADWFSPSDSWAYCGKSKKWSTAQAKVTRTGALWPLTVGATAQYHREATSWSTGDVSKRTTTCTVTDAVTVRRSSGELTPTYKVDCKDGRRTRTSWWSPESGLVYYRQIHRKRGVERFWERL